MEDGLMQAGRLGHVGALDGLRGVAIAAVLLYHAYGLPGGYLGVDLFFVLSGFLITALLLEEHQSRGGISLRDFYLRRARRLLPAGLAGIVIGEVILVVGFGLAGRLDRQLLAGPFAALYVENLAHFLHPPVILTLGHYWSLSQEEQFYFLWPPLLALLLRRRIPTRWLVGGLSVVIVAVIAHRASLAGAAWWRTYYAPDSRADGILLGCLLAVVWKAGLVPRGRFWHVAGPVALAGYIADLALVEHSSAASAWYGITVANVTAALMVASIVLAPRAPLSRLLSFAPARWLGLISYGLYVWGSIVGVVTGTHGITLVILCLTVACLSYRYLERPFRRSRAASPAATRPRPLARAEGGVALQPASPR